MTKLILVILIACVALCGGCGLAFTSEGVKVYPGTQAGLGAGVAMAALGAMSAGAGMLTDKVPIKVLQTGNFLAVLGAVVALVTVFDTLKHIKDEGPDDIKRLRKALKYKVSKPDSEVPDKKSEFWKAESEPEPEEKHGWSWPGEEQ